MLVTGQLLAHIDHEIGGPLAVELGGGLGAINAAGRHMWSMHGWVAALRASTTLSYVAGQAWLDLPADISGIATTEEGTLPFSIIDYPGHIQLANVGAGIRLGAIVMEDGVYRIQLTAAPTASLASAITIAYTRQWVDVESDLDVVDIPVWMEALLIRLVRAYARGYEGGDIDGEMLKVEASPILHAAKLQDAQIVRTLPRVWGTGAVEGMSRWDPHAYIRDSLVT